MNDLQEKAEQAQNQLSKLVMPIVVIVAIAAMGFFLMNGAPTSLGAELTLVDGDVELYGDSGRWTDALEGDAIEVGTKIRTEEGKAVIAFDEGSVLRLDANTEVEVLEISRDTIVVENLNGRVYSRVDATAGLTWTVRAMGTDVTALGTAYAVTCDKEHKKVAVDVLESKVKLKIDKEDGNVEKTVSEGQYVAVDLNKPVLEAIAEVELNKEAAKVDPFLGWNMSEDDKLSLAANLDAQLESSEEIKDESSEEVSEEKKEESSEEEVKEEEKEAPAPTPAPKPVYKAPSGAMTLYAKSDPKGIYLSWNTNGVSAPNGFKVVKSAYANPSYPKDSSQYVSGKTETLWKVNDGKAYHFRVCAWDGHNGCNYYSNDVVIEAPYSLSTETKKYEYISGELAVSATRTDAGVNLNWTSCSSPGFAGYKIVRSETNPNLAYPTTPALKYVPEKGNTNYLDFGAVKGKTYYYRICSIENDGRTFCGNVVTVK